MSSKILLKFLGGCLALFIVMGITTTNKAEAQVAASGKTETPASQIIVPVLQDDKSCNVAEGSIERNTEVQLTNTSTDGVTVHIQFLDANGCTEVDFFDTFTGEDTHVYDLGNCQVNDFGGACPIDTDRDGVLVITPVVSGQDNADAIAFNHLHGVVNMTTEAEENCWFDTSDEVDFAYRFNAVGRTAVNLASGVALEDGTVLDGAASGLETILPSELMYHYNSEFADPSDGAVYADLIVVAIADDYSIPNEYKAVNGVSSNFSVNNIVNDAELSISCGDRQFECLEVVGINNAITRLEDAHEEADVICDETAHETGYDRLVARPGATANATFAVLGVATSDVGGASHIFVE